MATFRAKPVVKEAVQFEGFSPEGKPLFECFNEGVPRWLAKAFNAGILHLGLMPAEPHLYVKTLEGMMHAPVGAYIVRGIKGELYPCDPSVFEGSYDMLRSGL